MKPIRFAFAMLFTFNFFITGCGNQNAGVVVDPMDAEGIAEFERLTAEQQMPPAERAQVTKEMLEQASR
jgi:hypothetical protein